MDIPPYLLFVLCLSIGYRIRRNVYLGAIDPLQLMGLSEAVWVVTVYDLARSGVASSEQVAVFVTCMFVWWSGWWYFAWQYGRAYRHSMAAFWRRLAYLETWKQRRLLWLYLVGLSILLIVTLASGGGGDNRLVIMKLLKPMESVTTLLVPVVLFHLLIAKGRSSKLMLIIVLLGMIITGGKSAILSILIPVTGAALIGRICLRIRTILALFAVILLGFAASVMINYGQIGGNPLDVLDALYTRISLDGDVYLLALNGDLLSQTETTSLTSYLLGPFIKLLFLPIPVDTAIGAQIFSLVRGEESVNGPAPHWDIVLLAYHRSALEAVWLSLLCVGVVLWLKIRLPSHFGPGKWPAWLVIPLGAYALLYPQTFFADPSFPVIYLAQAFVLAGVLSLVLRPAFQPQRNKPIAREIADAAKA